MASSSDEYIKGLADQGAVESSEFDLYALLCVYLDNEKGLEPLSLRSSTMD